MSDEIIVRGERPRIPRFGVRPGRGPIPRAPAEGRGIGIGPTGFAFVSPGLPTAIEEIVVTGKRTAQAAKVATRAPRVPAAGAIFAAVGGFLMAKILDEIGQQKLEREFEELMAIRGRTRPDSPLMTQPKPAEPVVIPEIIVTARRRSALFNLITGGMPMIPVPGAPPAPPRRPRRRPVREPRPPGRPRRPRREPGTPRPGKPPRPRPFRIPSPKPEFFPQTPIREVPRRDPATIPAQPPATITTTTTTDATGTAIRFATAPGAFPGAVPGAGVAPAFGISPALGIVGNPALTGIGSVVLPFPDQTPQAQPALQTARRCPPCPRKKQKDEERDKCYVQLVHQRKFKRWDRVTKWREIDCTTGRPV